MYALTRIQETVHAKNVSQSPSPSKEAARIVSNSKWIPLETRSAVEFRNRSAKDGSVPRGQLTRGNSRPLLVGGHGITDATCVESGISYWAAGFWAALQTGFLQPDSIMLIAYMHVSIWLIRWRVGSPFTSLLSRCVRARVRGQTRTLSDGAAVRSRNLDRGHPLMPGRPSASWTPSTVRNGISSADFPWLLLLLFPRYSRPRIFLPDDFSRRLCQMAGRR